MKKQYLVLISALLAVLALTACSGNQPPDLRETESRYERLSDAAPHTSAGDAALTRAHKELEEARHEWRNDGAGPDLDHLLYLTNRYMDIAEAQNSIQLATASRENIVDRQAVTALDRQGGQLGRARLSEEAYREQAAAYRAELEGLRQAMQSQPPVRTERGVEFAMTDVLFDFDRSALRPGAERKLDALANHLGRHPSHTVIIEGYADSVGSPEYNESLSARRAASVREYLVRRGVNSSRITARGMGEVYPAASNVEAAGRLANRRVVITLIGPEQG